MHGINNSSILLTFSEQYKASQHVPKKTTPIKTTPTKRKQQKRRAIPKEEHIQSDFVYEGVKFPPNLYTASAVARVLNQEPGKLNASELRQARSSGGGAVGGSGSRQLKEAVFIQRVKERADAEAKNRLRWLATTIILL